MRTQQTERRPVRTVLLAGVLAFLFFGTIDHLSIVRFRSSDVFYTDTMKETTMMKIVHAATVAEKVRPPIDLAAPAHTQTATFALG